MTVSQNTSFFSEERPITYEKLNEVLKFVKYREKADNIMYLDSIQISRQQSIINDLERKQDLFQKEINNLSEQVEIKDKRIANKDNTIKNIKQQFAFQLDEEKRKKRNWGLKGIIIGALVGGIIGINL